MKIKCPAKINLTLEVVNRRPDGFHNIKSIMQTISLYDYLTINISNSGENRILLDGTNDEIPYDERNLVYKAADLYFREAGIENKTAEIFIEKNIPVSAGLAGGSTDAAGTLWGLNYYFKKLGSEKINQLCAQLGSDLNVCLQGGSMLASSRGESIQKLPDIKSEVTVIKPKNLGISAREAYEKYDLKTIKPKNNMTEKMLEAIQGRADIKPYLYNDLEYAVFEDYNELKKIKEIYPQSIMTGSGSAYFMLENQESSKLGYDYVFLNNLHFVPDGAGLAEN